MKKWLMLALLLSPFASSYAQVDQQPLPADQAFNFSVHSVTAKGVNLTWQIAPGYHLYREKMQISLSSPKAAQLGKVVLPPGTPEENAIFGKFQQYQSNVSLMVPIHAPIKSPITLLVSYQGCQDQGICYPPVTKKLSFNLTKNALAKIEVADDTASLG